MALDKLNLDRWYNAELENKEHQERMSRLLESLAMKAAMKELVDKEMSLVGGTSLDLLKHRATERVAGGARNRPIMVASTPSKDPHDWFVPSTYAKGDFFSTGEIPRYTKTPEPEPEKLTPVPVTKPPQGFDWT